MFSTFQRVVDFVFPMVCLCCESDIAAPARFPVCLACTRTIKPAFPQPPKGLDAFYCGGVFEGHMRDLIHSYKYQGKEYLADYFSELCAQRWTISPGRVQAVVAVPLPFWRSLQRGFNPPAVVAKKLAQKWGVPVLENILKRRVGYPSQTHLTRHERRDNALRSFCLEKKGKRVNGGNILLVDDVLTTGATLSVCAKLLKDMGFERVLGATIAYDPLLPGRHSREGGNLGSKK